MRAIALCLGVAATGCLRGTEFRCAVDAECGPGGSCEAIGYCSVASADCPGGRAFSDTAGRLASTCVSAGHPGPGPDGGVDAPAAGCPPDYAVVGGSPHRYKALASVSWDDAKNDCSTGAAAYLAIPDDATELANLAAVAAAPLWIGVDNTQDEQVFVTQKGAQATFLPWGPGEPDVGAPPEHCVEAISATQIATNRCGNRHAAVCECEP
jgi:hypothetical protein